MGAPRRPSALLDGLQVGDDVTDLVGIKAEFRHLRMAGKEPLAQRFLQRLDRIAPRELAERRRVRARALAGPAYRMTRAALLLQQGLPAREVCRAVDSCAQRKKCKDG
jgi:hypothetical protein